MEYRTSGVVVALSTLAFSLFCGVAEAQVPGYPPQPSYPPGYVPPQPGYPYSPPPPQGGYAGYGGYGGYPPPQATRPTSSGIELGYLYGTAAAWGVGTGLWIDSEAKLCEPSCDPGLVVIAPVLLGAAAPVGVFVADRFGFAHGMPEGLPSAIATGMWIGAGEAVGIASYQYVTSDAANEWGFRGLARSAFIGSTVGGAAGLGLYYAIRPSPQTNMMLLSSTFWGTSIGAMFGGGASTAGANWGSTNDAVWLGGELGYNIGLAGALGLSLAWTPSWNQIGWMWGGFAIGSAAALPIYAVYAATDFDARRGLIVQGVTGTVGLGLGAIFGRQRGPAVAEHDGAQDFMVASERRPVAIGGAGLMPVQNGMGVQAFGTLW